MSQFSTELKTVIRSQYPIILVETSERSRFEVILNELCNELTRTLTKWNRIDGLIRQSKPIPDSDDPVIAVRNIYDICTGDEEPSTEVFLLQDFHRYLDHDEILVRLRILAPNLRYRRKAIVLAGPAFTIPKDLDKDVVLVRMPLPSVEELLVAFLSFVDETKLPNGTSLSQIVPAGFEHEAANAAQGLTTEEAYHAFIRAYVETEFSDSSDAIASILGQKEQIIRKGGILDYHRPSETVEDIGGLDVLKRWLDARGRAFYAKARQFGLPEPKGLLLCGVPGCGKSLTAKAVAARWRIPLLRLDVGRVFEGIVGSSESNVRSAIALAEAIAPCVLWLDEIEKGFAGVESSGATDGGTAARVFASFLTWLQEKRKPVFVIATANDIDRLPPELLRKGRFDETFFVDLPNRDDRQSIFEINLRKKKRDPARFDLVKLSDETQGFNGAEIESAVEQGLFSAFQRHDEGDADADLTMKDLLDSIRETVPLSATRRSQIEHMRKVAQGRFVFASTGESPDMPDREVSLTNSERGFERTVQLD